VRRSRTTSLRHLGAAAFGGDGKLAATEECDDGNRVSGDGCSSDCRHEIIVGYRGDVP
jgi:cysteine-rich repeat protein